MRHPREEEMRLFESVVVIVLAICSIQENSKQWSFRRESVEWRKFLLPSEEFKTHSVEMRFRRILSAKDPTTKILQVVLMDRPESLSLSEHGYNDISYNLWKLLFGDYQNGIPPFAELLAIGDRAAMRIRDDQGRVLLKVLKGGNPYEITACAQRMSLMHLDIERTDNAITQNPTGVAPPLNFFLVAQVAIDEGTARCAFDELRERTVGHNINVYVRNDPWFLQHSDYPVVSPFLVDVKPPTQQEYEEAIEWSCNSHGADTTCSGGHHRFQFGPAGGAPISP